MSTATEADLNTLHNLYERDYYAWAMQNATLIRQGRLARIDAENIAEELESMGRSEKRELTSRLVVLLVHLLKWQYQPERRGRSWQLTIEEQRRGTVRVLRDNPSLKASIDEIINDAYGDAILRAARETGLNRHMFSTRCPFTLAQVLDTSFLPGDMEETLE